MRNYIFIIFISLLFPFVCFSYIDDFEGYDLDILDEQYGWQAAVGESFYIQRWANQNTIGFGPETGYHDSEKRYFNNSLNGQFEIWFWNDFSYKVYPSLHYFLRVKDKEERICGLLKTTNKQSGSWYLGRWEDIFPHVYNENCDVASNCYIPTEMAIKVKIEWSNEFGGLKFRYTVPYYSVLEERVFYAETDWIIPNDSDCQFESDGVTNFDLTAYKNAGLLSYLLQINYTGDDLVYWPPYFAYDKTGISSLYLDYYNHNTTTLTWNLGWAMQGTNFYWDNYNELLFEVFDYEFNELASSTECITETCYNETKSWWAFPEYPTLYSFKFYFDYDDLPATTTDNITRYRTKTSFCNTSASPTECDLYHEGVFSIKNTESYRSRGVALIEREKELTAALWYVQLTSFLNDLGLGEFIDNWAAKLSSKFPFSWIIGIYSVVSDVRNESFESGGTFKVVFTLPATTTLPIILSGASYTIIDFEAAESQYGYYIGIFRSFLMLALWLSTIMVIYYKVKKFIMRLGEED